MSILKKMRKKGILDDLHSRSEAECAERDKEYEVLCVDDTGKGDLFDEGLTYIAKWHVIEHIIRVCDRNGEWQECIDSILNRVPAGNLVT